jgi:septum formation protein
MQKAYIAVNDMLILGSSSQIRQQLLQEEGVNFTAITSPFDEDVAKNSLAYLPHHQRALTLANGKAKAISETHPYDYVIGADQICADEHRVYDKPLTVAQAIKHLQYLQGGVHYQHSAACLFFAGKKIWEYCEIVTLIMRPLSEAEIAAYVVQDQPLQACGAYCYEKGGAQLFVSIDGSKSAIKGLPMQHLQAALQQFCPEFL